jgi:putative transposase
MISVVSRARLEFDDLRKRYWRQHVWARGYFVATAGNVTDEAVREYIRHQGTNEEQDDEFRIVNPTLGFQPA